MKIAKSLVSSQKEGDRFMYNKEVKILCCGGGWPTNIGNAFIDLGIHCSIKMAVPNSKVYSASNAVSWIFHTYNRRKINFLDLRSIIEADFYVFGGSMLNISWFREYSGVFDKLIKENSKIILYGVGGASYSDEEIDPVRKYLKKLNILAFISRDRKAFENYHDLAQYSYDGIDCAFFLNDTFTPAKLDLPEYVVFTFDSMAEPNLQVKERIIRTHHSPWRFSFSRTFSNYDLKTFLWNIISHQTNIVKKRDMLSDLPDDYLNLYANCKATYTDRVHACVAALSFGNRARLYSKSKRALLLDRIGLSSIRNELISLDREKIEEEKGEQIEFLRRVFDLT